MAVLTPEPQPLAAPRRPRPLGLTIEELRATVKYDPETGRFTWLRALSKRNAFIGEEAGYVARNGYRQIRIGYKLYYGHRLAFALMTGAWPAKNVDHINGVAGDDRWANLRQTDQRGNLQNAGLRRNKRVQFKGVWLKRKRYQARIKVGSKSIPLGVFATPEEAARAYDRAALRFFGEFARPNFPRADYENAA